MVEFAVMLPVMTLLVFGAIELSNGIFLKQTVSIAAYEGARTASRSTSTDSEVNSRIDEVLNSRGVNNQVVTITPSLATATRGTSITVKVSLPSTELGSAIPLDFLKCKTITRSVTMVRQ